VSESVAANNTSAGLWAIATSGHAPTTFAVFHSVLANNATGALASGTGATFRLAQSMVTGNATGWAANTGGVVASYGDNYIDGNGTNVGSLTLISKQ